MILWHILKVIKKGSPSNVRTSYLLSRQLSRCLIRLKKVSDIDFTTLNPNASIGTAIESGLKHKLCCFSSKMESPRLKIVYSFWKTLRQLKLKSINAKSKIWLTLESNYVKLGANQITAWIWSRNFRCKKTTKILKNFEASKDVMKCASLDTLCV